MRDDFYDDVIAFSNELFAIIQPLVRAEIEEIRGVTTSKGTLDVLLETGWIRLRGRRNVQRAQHARNATGCPA